MRTTDKNQPDEQISNKIRQSTPFAHSRIKIHAAIAPDKSTRWAKTVAAGTRPLHIDRPRAQRRSITRANAQQRLKCQTMECISSLWTKSGGDSLRTFWARVIGVRCRLELVLPLSPQVQCRPTKSPRRATSYLRVNPSNRWRSTQNPRRQRRNSCRDRTREVHSAPMAAGLRCKSRTSAPTRKIVRQGWMARRSTLP